MARETEVSRKIREAVKKHFPQIRFTRLQCGKVKLQGGYFMCLSDEGWSDYIGYLPDGRVFGMEIKDPSGHTKKERAEKQHARQEDMRLCGGVAIEVSSVEEALDKIKKVFNNDDGRRTCKIQSGISETET